MIEVFEQFNRTAKLEKGYYVSPPITVEFDLEPLEAMINGLSLYTLQALHTKLRYLRSHYPAEMLMYKDDPFWSFPEKGCIDAVWPSKQQVYLRRAEVFRKAPYDVFYAASEIAGLASTRVTVNIEKPMLFHFDMGCYLMFCISQGIKVKRSWLEAWKEEIDLWPIEKAVFIKTARIRRYLLRWYLLTGKISYGEFRAYDRRWGQALEEARAGKA